MGSRAPVPARKTIRTSLLFSVNFIGMHPSSARRAFSLVELSIVLVILGLLTGGILAGQSLIRAAELRSVSTDTARIFTAMSSFRDKYFAMPGDMTNATSFWGAAHADPATCRTTPSTDMRTCNGNGDGLLYSVDGNVTQHERMRIWQHLANAGLIEGNYTGVAGPFSIVDSIPGENVPRGKLSNSGYSFVQEAATMDSSSPYYFQGAVGLHITFGGPTGYQTNGPLLKPEEQWNLDTKLDDGKPTSGRVKSYKQSWQANCADGDTLSASYMLSTSGQTCTPLLLGF